MPPTFVGLLTSTCVQGCLLKIWLRHWPLHSSIHASTTPTLVIQSSTNIKRLQSVQNSVARVVLRDYSHRPAGDLPSELHWLPFSPQYSSRWLVSPTKYFPLVSLCICEPFSIITHQSTNSSLSNLGFPLNLANNSSVTSHLKHGTVYASK